MNDETRIDLPTARYFLSRDRDGAGDSGMMLEVFDWDEKKAVGNNYLQIGMGCRVGSHYARSFSAQDWWLTTPIKEFLEVERNDDDEVVRVRFLTESRNGSIYELRVD